MCAGQRFNSYGSSSGQGAQSKTLYIIAKLFTCWESKQEGKIMEKNRYTKC